jgi:hypothetical protein
LKPEAQDLYAPITAEAPPGRKGAVLPALKIQQERRLHCQDNITADSTDKYPVIMFNL